MRKQFKIIAGGLVSSGLITASAVGIVSADTAKNTNVGTSGIPHSVFKQERLEAASQVLNTNTANIQAAHKNKSFSQLISQAGLTKKSYAQKLKAQLTTDLEAKGYSQDQVTITLQHREIVRLHHKVKAKS